MEIHNRLNSIRVNERQAAEGAAGADGAPQSSDATAKDQQLSIKGIVMQLQSLPEMRASMVAMGRERVASGEYLTLDAAKATASAMLG